MPLLFWAGALKTGRNIGCAKTHGAPSTLFSSVVFDCVFPCCFFWTTVVCVHVLMIGCVRCLFISCCCIVLYSWGLDGFMKIGYGEIGLEQSFTAGYV